MRRLYLALTIAGLIAPVAFTAAFVTDHGLDLAKFLSDTFETTTASLVFADLAIASLAFWAWVAREAPRRGIRRWGLFYVANVFVGLCFALPLFLYVRQGKLDAADRAA